MKKLSPLFLALSISALAATGANAANAISGGSGNWASSGINTPWNSGNPPVNGDDIFIRGSATVTANTVTGTMASLNIGEGTLGAGTLLINAGGSVVITGNASVMRRNNQTPGASGTLTITGGTFATGASGAFAVGAATGTTSSGTGTFNISGPSTVTIGNAMTLGSASSAAAVGNLNVIGSQADVTGTSLTVAASGNIRFTLDATGIADLVFSGAASFATGSTITIDGTSFSGLAGNYTLVDAGTTLTGFGNISFNYVGFNPGYTPIVNFDSGSQSLVLNVTGVPEPSTYAMVGVGLAAVLFGLRRRRAA